MGTVRGFMDEMHFKQEFTERSLGKGYLVWAMVF